MEYITSFFSSSFFTVVGGIYTLISILGLIYVIYLVIKGTLPIWYRLGIGLSKREIAVFAKNEFPSLESLLVDSKIFKKNNIIQIHENSLKKAKGKSVYLVHWIDFSDKLNEILALKDDNTALIIYVPHTGEKLNNEQLNRINEERNSTIVNFRGRLLNDILVSLITTSYK